MFGAKLLGNGKIRFTLAAGLAVLLLALAYFIGYHDGRMKEFHARMSGELLRTCVMLRDLESNKVSEVKAQLNDNALSAVVLELTACNFTTNVEVLIQKPGLRAAAGIWGSEKVPHIQPYDSQFFDLITNRLALVKDALEKRRLEKNK